MFYPGVARDFVRSGGADILLQLIMYRDSRAPPSAGPTYIPGQDLVSGYPMGYLCKVYMNFD